MDEKKTTIFQHLEELRRAIIISLLAVLAGALVSYGLFDEVIRRIVLGPVDALGKELVLIGVTEGLLVQLKLALAGGMILASPLVIWQVLNFVWPALYRKEKRIFIFALLSSVLLFAAGIAFAYLIVLTPGLKVLLFNFSAGLTAMISLSNYVSFVMAFLLPFGFIFQIPLVTLLLSRAGLISPGLLRRNRGYVVLAIFILAAFLSPGADVFTQFMLAGPMLALFEVSILISAIFTRTKK